MKYILVHDLGTSGNKSTLFGENGDIVASEISSYETIHSGQSEVEQNPEDWWQSVVEATKKLTQKIDVSDIASVSFSGHMQGIVCVDKNAKVLHNSLIWMDQRASQETDDLVNQLGAKKIYEITGHRPSPVYSLEKFMWIKKHKPDVYRATYKMLNTKDYIVLKLTDRFVTDYTDASGTNALNLKEKKWSKTMLEAAGIDVDKMPEIVKSIDVVGHVTEEAAKECGLLAGTPVVAGGGDGVCATVGAGSVNTGDTYCCMGTSAWIASTSDEPSMDEEMTVFNFVHMIEGKYVPCGAMSSSGTAYDWGLKMLIQPGLDSGSDIYVEAEKLMATSPPGSNDLVFLPYMHGERSPRWNPNARGSYFGLTTNHNQSDMLRAIVEGITYNLDIILKVIARNNPVQSVTVIGGGTNKLWHQVQSDVFGLPVVTVKDSRYASAIGAAIAGGIGIGLFDNFDVVNQFLDYDKTYKPNESAVAEYNKLKSVFELVYQGLTGAYELLASK